MALGFDLGRGQITVSEIPMQIAETVSLFAKDE
jgi:hypothetical protein